MNEEAILRSRGPNWRRLQELTTKAGYSFRRLSDEELFRMRRELDLQLRPYRGKMTADQLVRLEKTYLDKKVYDHFRLPRLSLFYIT